MARPFRWKILLQSAPGGAHAPASCLTLWGGESAITSCSTRAAGGGGSATAPEAGLGALTVGADPGGSCRTGVGVGGGAAASVTGACAGADPGLGAPTAGGAAAGGGA